MLPTDTYHRFLKRIKGKEHEKKSNVFGILFADLDQPDTKAYILNYINRFNKNSGKYIDFILPGYLDHEFYPDSDLIEINGEKFYFSRTQYEAFMDQFIRDFGEGTFQNAYTPTLYLMEYQNGNFNKTKFLVFDLDDGKGSIKNTGIFFDKIFDLAKKGNGLLEMNNIITLDDVYNYTKNDMVDDLGYPLFPALKRFGEKIIKLKHK